MEQAGRGRNVSPNRTKQEYIIYRIGHMMSSIIIHQTLRVCGQRERDQIMYFTILMHWLLLLWCWMTTMNDNDTRKARYDNAPAIKYNWNRLKWMRRKTNANFYYYYSIYKFPNQGKNKMEGAAAHKFSPLALGQSVVGWGFKWNGRWWWRYPWPRSGINKSGNNLSEWWW